MQLASFFRIAIIVPLIANATGSLKTDLLTNSISCPGVKPISKILCEDECELSTSVIIALSPNFRSAAVLKFLILFLFNHEGTKAQSFNFLSDLMPLW